MGYQLVYGFGVGMEFGQPSYVVQTLLTVADVPISVTLITLVQNLSASVFVAVAQSIFQSEMRKRLVPLVPADEASGILGSALPQILAALPSSSRELALDSISKSIVKTFYVPLGLSAASIVGIGVKWSSMKKGNPEKTVEADGGMDGQQNASAKHVHNILTDHEHERAGQTSMVRLRSQESNEVPLAL